MANGALFGFAEVAHFITLSATARLEPGLGLWWEGKGAMKMSYGTNIASTFRQVGIYTGSILKGATPADLPVIQSTKFEFVLNARTAKVLGIELSPLLLTRA